MNRPRILAAVRPGSLQLVDAALGRDYAVTHATSLTEAAMHLSGSADFSLILCSVHFDGSRVLDLLQSIASNPKAAPVPVLCVRAERGVLQEAAYGALSFACSALGARYLDVTHWIDAEGRDAARRMFEGVVASMIRHSGRRTDINDDEYTE
jgi:CheY-like chemotaxis protein